MLLYTDTIILENTFSCEEVRIYILAILCVSKICDKYFSWC